MRITINTNVYRPWDLQQYDLDGMSELMELLVDNVGVFSAKDEQALLVPVSEWSHFYRLKGYVRRSSSLFCADLDKMSLSDLEDVTRRLDGLSCILYPTYSNLSERKGGTYCYRALLELTDEYDPWDLPVIWTAVNALVGGRLDPATINRPDLGYYLPSHPASSGQVMPVRGEGDPLNLHELLDIGAQLGGRPELPQQFTGSPIRPQEYADGTAPSKTAIRIKLNAWKQQGDEQAERALLLLDGKPSFAPGERNTGLFSVARRIGATWRNSDPCAIAEAFNGVGWDMLNTDGDIPLSTLADMIHRQQCRISEQVEQQQSLQIAEATAGARSESVTDSEIERLESNFGTMWRQHIVAILHKSVFFLKPDSTYDPAPITKDNIFVAARSRLAVFGDEIEYTYETKEGPKRKTLSQFLEEYGTVVDKAVYDLCRPEGGWDAMDRAILLPVGHRKVGPVEHPEIQAWLDTCDPILTDMLSRMPNHDRMLPALLLTGSSSTGKTLLAKGISRIYADGPSPAEAALDKYNGQTLVRCPIVFMDESAAPQYKKEGTTFLRRFLVQDTWHLDEKHLSRMELHGYLRMIIAGNSTEIMSTEEEMSSEDREAFSERLVHVCMDPGKEELGKHAGDEIQHNWLDKRHLAEHVLWLSENWQIKNPGKRFAVRQPPNAFHASISSYAGTGQEVLYWLLSYLAAPHTLDTAGKAIQVCNGELRVHPTTVVQNWSTYITHNRIPGPAAISRAVRAISTGYGHRKKIPTASGWANAYVVDTAQLRAANEMYSVVDDLDAALNRSPK